MATITVAHAISTLLMTGLALFVQVVHYPLFALVDGDFGRYSREHARRTGIVVGPLMIVEAATATALVVILPGLLTAIGMALVAILWLATALVQAPCHRRLAAGFDPQVWRRLVATSWIRTAAWLARSAIAITLIFTVA